jgi:hypothetical protein
MYTMWLQFLHVRGVALVEAKSPDGGGVQNMCIFTEMGVAVVQSF